MRQQEAIQYFFDAFTNVNGIKALFLKGSLARGTGDEWSDVDLYCLVEESFATQFMQIREGIMLGFKPVILYEEVDFGKPQLIAIYDNHLHVDLYMTTEIPDVSYEPIKVIHDPFGVLPAAMSPLRGCFDLEVGEHLNEVIYTFHELDIAVKRGDYIWAQRLGSHILAGLSLALCNEHHTALPMLHIKGLTQKLPESTQERMLVASNLLGNGNYSEAIKILIDLCECVIYQQNPIVKAQLRLPFLAAFKSF